MQNANAPMVAGFHCTVQLRSSAREAWLDTTKIFRRVAAASMRGTALRGEGRVANAAGSWLSSGESKASR
jgi:hypothetical protein